MNELDKFYDAWHFLDSHPYFKYDGIEYFASSLTIDIVRVNPETKKIEEDESKNTLTQVWLECGPPYLDSTMGEPTIMTAHDIELDTGGYNFEDAIINLAKLLVSKEKYLLEHREEKYGPIQRERRGEAPLLPTI